MQRPVRNKNVFTLSGSATFMGLVLIVCGALCVRWLEVPPKWYAAMLGTVGPFWYVGWVLRSRWRFRTFWVSFAAWLGVHLIVIWILFHVLFHSLYDFPVFLWIPVGMLETLVLYMGISGYERRLRKDSGKNRLEQG